MILKEPKFKLKLHKGTVVYLEKKFKKFEDSAMLEVVVGDGKTYTIPEKWKINVE